MTVLLDSNVSIATVVADHTQHEVAQEWFIHLDEPFVTCPITQGALMRLVLRNGGTANQGPSRSGQCGRARRSRVRAR